MLSSNRTQNKNESLHNLIWSFPLKISFAKCLVLPCVDICKNIPEKVIKILLKSDKASSKDAEKVESVKISKAKGRTE